MSIGVFMDRLEGRGVTFALIADALCVEIPLGAPSVAERHELIARREEVERLVRAALGLAVVAQPTATNPARLTFGQVA